MPERPGRIGRIRKEGSPACQHLHPSKRATAASAMRPPATPVRRRWCSCMASAVRRGRGAASSRPSAIAIARSPGTCRAMAARRRFPAVSIATLADALQDFLKDVGAVKPVLVGHSIGGMIVQQWLTKHPDAAAAVVLAQTSPAFGKADGDWQKEFIGARLGPLDRGETMASLAPIAGEGIDRRRCRYQGDGACARLHGGGARGELSRHACWRCWDSTCATR